MFDETIMMVFCLGITDEIKDSGSSSIIVIILSIVFALLFLALLVLVIYHYRTNLHSKILKCCVGRQPVVAQTSYNKQMDNLHLLNNSEPTSPSSPTRVHCNNGQHKNGKCVLNFYILFPAYL